MNSIDFHLPTIFSHIPYAKGIGFVLVDFIITSSYYLLKNNYGKNSN